MVWTEAGLLSRLQRVTQSLALAVRESVWRATVSEVLQTSNVDRVKDDVQAGDSHSTACLLGGGRHSGYLTRKVSFDRVEAQWITRDQNKGQTSTEQEKSGEQIQVVVLSGVQEMDPHPERRA